ncbi:SDR family NAD(P)-dependent oxidoreductase [Epilithonimonas hungarica]|uniref:3-oxoacyl-[acyl-carrier protein] reductase n=1 Tax=Epilithonimonas hungarica TaxID=454006 RepID=A0A1G7SBT5_9FLAO|nr:glucose 1-dehydrogenase [Epilithonimonas hungarica]SDG20441.1 3-oxoacyl-[acyl-carrier protein] reductase [Epilithonimonas hungarica]
MGKLKNKVAIITGAASGIGKAQALLFAKEEAKVVVVDLNLDGIQDTVSEIKAKGGQAIGVQANLTNDDDISNLVEKVISEYGEISILLNTAGLFDQYKSLLNTDESLWNKMLDVNITSLYKITSKVLPHMLEKKFGVIVNIASGAGLIAGGGGIGYTSTKHAVIGFTKQLNFDYGTQGIRANAIAPGLIETPMVKAVIDDPNSGVMDAVSKLPAGRYGQPGEVADLSLFLASDDSRYIYGAVVPIDGGLLSTLR